MIPVAEVHAAHLALLRGDWPHVGEGAPPAGMPPEDRRPWAWYQPAGGPGSAPRMAGGEPDVFVRFRVSAAAIDGDSGDDRVAMTQATMLADRQRALVLTGAMQAGETWRVAGRWRESTIDEPEPGAWTIHQDFRLWVVTITP